jgi:hypothetical protein
VAIESFLINVGLSIVGNWLFPKKKDQPTAEDVPSLGQGSDIYLGWGLFIVPGNLLYATPANIAGHGNDRSTFGVLGIANPEPDCDLVAIRINNIIGATKTPLFPITDSANPGIYSSTGFQIKKELNFATQNFNIVPNPQFQLNGYSGLQYQGLSWVAFSYCDRQKYGGFNSRVSLVYSNKSASSTNVPFTIKGDDTVTVDIGINFGTSKNFWGHWFSKTFTKGFFGVRYIYIFDQQLYRGVIATSSGYDTLLIAQNTEFEPYGSPKFIVGSISPDILPGVPGTNGILGEYTVGSTYISPVQSNVIIIAEEGKETKFL